MIAMFANIQMIVPKAMNRGEIMAEMEVKAVKNDTGEITLEVKGKFVIWNETTSVEQERAEFEALMYKYAI